MKIFSVIVCYNPEIVNLSNLCRVLSLSEVNIILVDNTEISFIEDISNSFGAELIKLDKNSGIAKAQNIGITYALENNAEVVVFFDQDSVIENDFIANLIKPLTNIGTAMVVSPVFFDEKQGFRFPSYRLNKFGLLKRIKVIENDEMYDVDMIISSGSAATKTTFDIVGLMNEEYFIDFVDTEWILRCRAKKIPVKVISSAIMKHSIGDKSINLRFMRIFIHSPIRSYYKVRNSFLFFRNKDVPLMMGIKEIFSALIHNFLTIIVSENKSEYLKNYFRAIKDGLLGITGKKI